MSSGAKVPDGSVTLPPRKLEEIVLATATLASFIVSVPPTAVRLADDVGP